MAKKKKEENVLLTTKENILLEDKVDVKVIKTDLEKYVDDKINKVFIEEIDKANRKLLREKSRKIFIKNIVIVLLLLIIGFLIYLLYSNNYFDHFFNKNNSEIKEKNEIKEDSEETKKEEIKKEEVKKPTLDDLKKKYASLLDNYYISDKCKYLEDYYKGELTDNLKKYITLNSFDFDSIKKEDDYQIILNDTFKLAYEKLFDGDYNNSSFDYNGNTIRFVSMMSSYMTTTFLKKEDNLIKREIKDIKLENDQVIITTVEGIVKDQNLFNILDNSEINNYENDSLLKYSDDLNILKYTFKGNKLINLSK